PHGNGRLYPSRSWPSARFAPARIRHSDQEASPHDENGLETAPRVEHSGRSADRTAADARTKVSCVSAIAHLRSRASAPSRNDSSILGGKNTVTARLQPDGFAGLQFPVAGRVDLDHGLAFAAAQRDLGALDRAEAAD